MVTSDLERPLFEYITGKGNALDAIVYAVGGVEGHIHLVESLPPKPAIADVVGHLKGASAHWVNQRRKESAAFAWQRGYGVFSLGAKQLTEAVEYVRQQKVHRAEGSVIQWLERFSDEDDGPASSIAES